MGRGGAVSSRDSVDTAPDLFTFAGVKLWAREKGKRGEDRRRVQEKGRKGE